MTRDELIAADPQPGDKVWLKPVTLKDSRFPFHHSEIDRIEKAPRPLKVGDRVRCHAGSGVIIAIDGQWAWWKLAEGHRIVTSLANLEPIDPEPGQ